MSASLEMPWPNAHYSLLYTAAPATATSTKAQRRGKIQIICLPKSYKVVPDITLLASTSTSLAVVCKCKSSYRPKPRRNDQKSNSVRKIRNRWRIKARLTIGIHNNYSSNRFSVHGTRSLKQVISWWDHRFRQTSHRYGTGTVTNLEHKGPFLHWVIPGHQLPLGR
jgi:hypothetical protein